MIKDGLAYADDTDGETMKNEREQRIKSKCRNNCKPFPNLLRPV